MARFNLPYLNRVRTKGKDYWYYRRGGVRQAIEGQPGTGEFFACYERIHAGFEVSPAASRTKPGTFDALVVKFYNSPEFRQLKASTRADYRSYLDLMRMKYGGRNPATMTRRFVLDYRNTMQDTPAKANNAIKTLRRLLAWAVSYDILRENVATGVPFLKAGPGWQPWPVAALEKMEKESKGPARTAFLLALYTGQRKGDVLRMRRDAIKDGRIRVRQEKTGKSLWIPLHTKLSDVLAKSDLHLVCRANGQPLSLSGFNSAWRRETGRIGLRGLPFHGLRKNAAQALAELGCTSHQIAAITGHATLSMVEHYTKAADQTRMADQVAEMWRTSDE